VTVFSSRSKGERTFWCAEELEPDVNKATIKALRKLSVQGKRQLVANSPVGKTGLLRRSWYVQNNIPAKQGPG
jgi:hypothetical protein